MVSQMIGPGSEAHNYHRSVVISTFWVYTSCDSYYSVSRLIPDTNPASNLYFLLTGCDIMAYLVEFSAITKILLTSREITKKITKNFHYYQKSPKNREILPKVIKITKSGRTAFLSNFNQQISQKQSSHSLFPQHKYNKFYSHSR
jgi:hypothetical protein